MCLLGSRLAWHSGLAGVQTTAWEHKSSLVTVGPHALPALRSIPAAARSLLLPFFAPGEPQATEHRPRIDYHDTIEAKTTKPTDLQGRLVLGAPAAALLSQDLDVGGHNVTQSDDHNVACGGGGGSGSRPHNTVRKPKQTTQ